MLLNVVIKAASRSLGSGLPAGQARRRPGRRPLAAGQASPAVLRPGHVRLVLADPRVCRVPRTRAGSGGIWRRGRPHRRPQGTRQRRLLRPCERGAEPRSSWAAAEASGCPPGRAGRPPHGARRRLTAAGRRRGWPPRVRYHARIVAGQFRGCLCHDACLPGILGRMARAVTWVSRDGYQIVK